VRLVRELIDAPRQPEADVGGAQSCPFRAAVRPGHHAAAPATTPPPPATTPAAPAAPPTTTPAHTANPIPQGNGGDHDADNNGGPSDGDGNI
jgi:hypothetical protein